MKLHNIIRLTKICISSFCDLSPEFCLSATKDKIFHILPILFDDDKNAYFCPMKAKSGSYLMRVVLMDPIHEFCLVQKSPGPRKPIGIRKKKY